MNIKFLISTISLSTICSYLNVNQNLFLTIWNELMNCGNVPGHIIGAKNSIKSLYVPKVQEELSKKFVRTTFDENNFLGLIF